MKQAAVIFFAFSLMLSAVFVPSHTTRADSLPSENEKTSASASENDASSNKDADTGDKASSAGDDSFLCMPSLDKSSPFSTSKEAASVSVPSEKDKSAVVRTASSSKNTYPAYYGQYGSAKYIDGTTVIVSIFADDKNTSWNFKDAADKKLRKKILKRMQIGFDWLVEQVKEYGAHTTIYWDFMSHDDLRYRHKFKEDLISGSNSYSAIRDYISDNINIEKIMKNYGADDVVFFVHLNAPSSNNYRSFTFDGNWRKLEKNQYFYETCVMVPYGRGVENTPAVYAHEFMHCYGALDFYTTYNGTSAITQEYVDHLAAIRNFDIMRQCFWSDYDRVTNTFSIVNAYYMGLISGCNDVRNFKLGKSCFQIKY